MMERRKFQDILLEHGLGDTLQTVDEKILKKAVGLWLPEVCAKICSEYCGNLNGRFNFITTDTACDALILSDVRAKTTYRKHWLITNAEQYGVPNALIRRCGRHKQFNSADTEFVVMFVGVAKYYGEEIFFETLRYCGPVDEHHEHFYFEVMNQVAEYFLKVNTRCLLGMLYCHCYQAHSKIYDEYFKLCKQTYNLNVSDNELEFALLQHETDLKKKYFPLVLVFNREKRKTKYQVIKRKTNNQVEQVTEKTKAHKKAILK
jgi:hypothetical protein